MLANTTLLCSLFWFTLLGVIHIFACLCCFIHVICRYRIPKHIKIYQRTSGLYYVTEPKAFNSIPVTTVSSIFQDLSSLVQCACVFLNIFPLLCQLSKVLADILPNVCQFKTCKHTLCSTYIDQVSLLLTQLVYTVPFSFNEISFPIKRDTWHYCWSTGSMFVLNLQELVQHFQQNSLETCFSHEVPTALLYPYKTAIAQMNGKLAIHLIHWYHKSSIRCSVTYYIRLSVHPWRWCTVGTSVGLVQN